jgi:hypothetical protein
MTANAVKCAHRQCQECDVFAEILHAMSQPLTALEIGLEISLRQDKDFAQMRSRLEAALEIAQTLHARMVELRNDGRCK